MISAEIILDSISEPGHRLTTFALRYPRFIHSEFMTHRQFSRNASSSRAVPTKKLLDEVRSDELRAAPVFWGKNQKGMQAVEQLPVQGRIEGKATWKAAAMMAADYAEHMAAFVGAHKQIVNRILEPFLHINVVCTATEYMNFFGLRLDAGAQPEMRALALAMWKAYKSSTPKLLKLGEWHLPYILPVDSDEHGTEMLRKISAARCARVSYKSFVTGKISTMGEDLALYDKIMSFEPVHASPTEHQATPDVPNVWKDHHPAFLSDLVRIVPALGWRQPLLHGNFVGWCQFRKMIPGESCAPLPPGVDTL